MPTWHMLQLMMMMMMMMMMKVMTDVEANDEDEEDGDEIKNNDIYGREMEVEDYHTPYDINISAEDSDDDDCEV